MTINAVDHDLTIRFDGTCFPSEEVVSNLSVNQSEAGDTQSASIIGDAIAPVISQPPHAEIAAGNTFSYSPSLSEGSDVFWWKEYGPDGMSVDPETGAVSWDTSDLPRGQGINVGLGCSNRHGEDVKWFCIHVDNTGGSQSYVLGVDTTATTIRAACAEISGGDTLIIPAGDYWASVSSTDSYENTFADSNGGAMPSGTSSQLTTLISPGGAVIDGSPHASVGRQSDAGFEMLSGQATLRNYVKFCHMEWKGSERQSIIVQGDNLVFELCGAADCGYAQDPTTFSEADAAYGSVAAGYLQGDGCVWENSYAYGQFRYGLQFGLDITGSLAARNIIRPDEYHGDQPRGGLIHYRCDDVGAYNNFVVDADREDLTPFYSNFAGAFACPATGNEGYPETFDFDANAAINVEFGWGLIDSTEGSTVFENRNSLCLSSTDAVAPQTGNSGSMGVMSDHVMALRNAGYYRLSSFDGPATLGAVRAAGDSVDIVDSIFYQIGWNGSSTEDDGDILEGTSSDMTDCNVYDEGGGVNTSGGSTTGLVTTDPLVNGWDYPIRVEDGSPLATAGIGPDLTTFKNPSHHMPGDTGWQTETSVWAWPHPAEQYIRSRMRDYSKTGLPVRNGTNGNNPTQFDGSITGVRGFCDDDEAFSEYVVGHFGRTVFPLRVGAKLTDTNEVTFWIAPYRSSRGDTITKFNIYESTDMDTPIASITDGSLKAVVTGISSGSHTYYIRAVDSTQIGAYDANETGESGNSRALVIQNGAVTANLTANQTEAGDTQTVSIDAGGSDFLVENLSANGSITSFGSGSGNMGSDVTWNDVNDTILVLANSNDYLDEYPVGALTSARTREIDHSARSFGYNDMEGVCWMGQNPTSGNYEYAICSEGAEGRIQIFEYTYSTSNQSGWNPIQILTIFPADGNDGAEGICYDRANRIFYMVKERVPMEFWKVIRPTNESTDYDWNDSELEVSEPFDAASAFSGEITDQSSIEFHAPTGNVLILSDESNKILQVDPNGDGTIISEFNMPSSAQWEGISFRDSSYNLIVSAEGAQFQLLDIS